MEATAADLRATFGKAVERERKAAGLTQIELAHKADSSQAAISRLESGLTFDLETATKVAAALGKKVHELMGSEEVPS